MYRASARIMIRIFYTVLILTATAATLLIVFLSQLDLENYRSSLEQQLGSALKQPVRIGHSALTYNRGLALELQQLQIGPDDAALAKIPRITATLKVKPLIHGQFILDQVRIENPSFQFWLPFPDRPARGTSHKLVNSLGISILTIHNAELQVYQRQEDRSIKRMQIDNLHAVLRGWQPQTTGHLVVTGRIPERSAEFLLETRLPSSVDPEVWRQEEHRTRLHISHFTTESFPGFRNQNYPKAVDLELAIEGAPASGTQFNLLISAPRPAEQIFTLSGRWVSSPGQDSITELNGSLLDIPLAGELHYIRQPEQHFLAGSFGTRSIALTPELMSKWRIPNADKLVKGELERLTINLEKNWDPSRDSFENPRLEAELTLCNLNWDTPELKQLQDFSVDLSLENRNLLVRNGVFVAGGQVIDFSGRINSLLFHPSLDLRLNFSPQLEEIKAQLEIPATWEISGQVPGVVHLSGPILRPEFLIQADLTPTNLGLGRFLTKSSTDKSALSIQGRLLDNRLQLDNLSLTLDDLNLAAEGDIQLHREERLFSFRTQPVGLEQLRRYSPLLQQLKAQGKISATFQQLENGPQGTLELDKVGAHLTSVIADLNNVSGSVLLDPGGLRFSALNASLGSSELLLEGSLGSWRTPQLNLHLFGKNVRAQDLVFSNRTMLLDEVNGRLLIDRNGIRFSPVQVKLGEETLATVSGAVSDFQDPQVSLDIRSRKVNVLDIINLFSGPRTRGGETKPGKRNPILITVSADQGTLGGLRFKNADALIRDHNGLFTIFPLEFKNGEGWCQAKVTFNRKEEIAPLQVSGHVEDIDASVLHQDVFAKRGLINGSLNGDFYIEGDPGNGSFWHTAKGGMHLEVKEGTLRKFHGLAKVFSLLNVSQIFAGKLPDMDQDGMPFNYLEGSMRIADGLLHTEDLRINSEAMNLSLIGSRNLRDDTLDFILGVMPLRTVDKVITSIPIAGWVLTGEEKALLTAHFKIEGTGDDPLVTPIPINSVSGTVLGIFRRTLGLPGKLVNDIGSIFKKEPEKKKEAATE